MDFELPGDDDPRRVDVRTWLAEHRSPTGRQQFVGPASEQFDRSVEGAKLQ